MVGVAGFLAADRAFRLLQLSAPPSILLHHFSSDIQSRILPSRLPAKKRIIDHVDQSPARSEPEPQPVSGGARVQPAGGEAAVRDQPARDPAQDRE